MGPGRSVSRALLSLWGAGQSQRGDEEGVGGQGGSPLFEQRSVHGEAQHGEHRGADARPQPEGGVLQVGLSHVPDGRGVEGGRQETAA